MDKNSTDSDGNASLEEMAGSAKSLGFSYIGMSEHSQTAAYARGLTVRRVKEQWDRIDALNESHKGIRILKGIESDILPDGSLDYPDEVLAGFDFVIGSIHMSFGLDRAEQTRRILHAMRIPTSPWWVT